MNEQPHILMSQASDEADPARAADLRARATLVAANIERAELREQAWRNHKANLEDAERRYQAELSHIDEVYELRIGGEK